MSSHSSTSSSDLGLYRTLDTVADPNDSSFDDEECSLESDLSDHHHVSKKKMPIHSTSPIKKSKADLKPMKIQTSEDLKKSSQSCCSRRKKCCCITFFLLVAIAGVLAYGVRYAPEEYKDTVQHYTDDAKQYLRTHVGNNNNNNNDNAADAQEDKMEEIDELIEKEEKKEEELEEELAELDEAAGELLDEVKDKTKKNSKKDVDVSGEDSYDEYAEKEENDDMSADDAPDSLFDRPWVVLTAGGCEGSTAVGRFFDILLNAHGLKSYTYVPFGWGSVQSYKFQLYNQVKAELEEQAGGKEVSYDVAWMEASRRAVQAAKEKRQVFVFKQEVPEYDSLHEEIIRDMNGVYAAVVRDNAFDRCICMVRDCFHNKQFGYPVYGKDGTETNECFDRRAHPEDNIKAMITNPWDCFENSFDKHGYIRKQGFPTVTNEDLFEFEYTEDEQTFDMSVDAWYTLLQTYMGDYADRNKIVEALRPMINSRTPPPPQSTEVYNIDEMEKLMTEWDMLKYFRPDEKKPSN